jgi:hypothetical protein
LVWVWSKVVEAKGLNVKSSDKPSIYCVVSVNNVHYNTSPSDRGQKPEWKQKFTFVEAAIQPKDAQLRVILFNKSGAKDVVIGEADINLSDLTPNQSWKEWHSLGDEKGKAKVLLDINLLTDAPSSQKRKNRMNESLTRRISWGAKQTATAAIVSPNKKHVEESSSDDEEADNTKAAAPGNTSTPADASGAKRRRVFDFVGTGTDAEMYEDQFKQAYQDETDMEDAFATDDTKETIMDDSDAQNSQEPNGRDRMPTTLPDDSTEAGIAPTEEGGSVAGSEKLRGTKASSASQVASAPAVEEGDVEADDSVKPSASQTSLKSEKASSSPAPASPSKPSKPKKPKRSKTKAVKTMDSVLEEGEEDEESASAANQAPASSVAAQTPTRKKSMSSGILSFFKRIGTPKHSKAQAHGEEGSSAEVPAPLEADTVVAATPSKEGSGSPGEAPRTPRGAKPKSDLFEAMKMELRTHVELEKAYLTDLNTLLTVYLLPSREWAVPIEHITALIAPVEQIVAAHSETLKLVEKRMKDDSIAIGTLMDDLLAEVSDSYKQYRSKQVLLLSLLDSSPTEKSEADHAAISNWLEETLEKLAVEKPNKQVAALQELILEPTHRLARLAFTLEQLVAVTPQTHPDHPNIRKAAARIQLLQSEVSTRGTTYRSMAKLSEIDAMLEFPFGTPSFQLADEASKRSYLLEGYLYQLEQQVDHSQFNKVFLFLFSDMLLFCKQLARDPTSPRSSSSAKNSKRSSSTIRPTMIPRQTSSSRQPSGVQSVSQMVGGNKFIVVSKLMLDRIFIVDPENTKGEMATFSQAKAKSKKSSSNVEMLNSTGKDVVASSEAEGENRENMENGGNDENEMEELQNLDCLLEIVDMGVTIHRLRFRNKEDKKLWLATLNSALSNVKLSFNVNERQYLYKLLLTQQVKPIFGAIQNSDRLALWPTSSFVASLASRQLIERLHSNTFATVNLHRNASGVVVAASAPDSEVSLIKAEVVNLKREHQRKLADLNSQLELTQEENAALQKLMKERDEQIANATPSKGRRSRSGTLEGNTSGGDATVKKRKKSSIGNAVDDRAEEYLAKYLDLMSAVNAREKREQEMVKRMEAAELSMKEQAAQFATAMGAMMAHLERSEREWEASKADRKKASQQQEKLTKLVERLFSEQNVNPSDVALSASASAASSSTLATTPVRGSTPNQSSKSGTAASPSDKLARTNSGAKPPVPSKQGIGSTASPAGVKPVMTPSSPGWRGSQGSPSASSVASGYGSASSGASSAGVAAGSGLAGGDGKPASAIPTFGNRGKRPSSISLIAVAPLDTPPVLVVDGVTVANSADSSESSGPTHVLPGSSPAPPPSALGRVGVSTPNLFGASGKSPSRLDLGGASPLNGSSGGIPSPVSPGGRGKERKVKNVRFPAGGDDQGKTGGWLRQKLGLSQPKPRKDDGNSSPAPWRQPPASAASPDGPVTVKKPNKVDWSQARAESYFSDDLGSDYDPAMALSPSDFERAQEEYLGHDHVGSDYSDADA